MKKLPFLFTVFCLMLASVCIAQPVFVKHIVSSRFVAEGAAAGDVNHDGKTDIFAGNYWFEAPDWTAHMLHADTLNPIAGYSTTFLNYASDINNDGWIDLIRFDQPGGVCVWYENPAGKITLWQSHTILNCAGIENPAFVDVDKDGKKDIICNDTLKKQIVWFKSPVAKNDTVWQRFVISRQKGLGTDKYTHGLGWGDVNKDDKNDVLIKNGWWQSPDDVTKDDWVFHPADFGEDCANMFVTDVDGDGDEDVVSSSAHHYGLWWHEQKAAANGSVNWQTHLIDSSFSQSHGLAMADINGDGNPDFVTGKRYRAHNGGDPGTSDAAVLYWFEFKPGKDPVWVKHLIDDDSGIGLSFVVEDMNNDQLPDIVISNKKGVFFFEQTKK